MINLKDTYKIEFEKETFDSKDLEEKEFIITKTYGKEYDSKIGGFDCYKKAIIDLFCPGFDRFDSEIHNYLLKDFDKCIKSIRNKIKICWNESKKNNGTYDTLKLIELLEKRELKVKSVEFEPLEKIKKED